MKLFIDESTFIDTEKGHDISLPLSPDKGPIAWYSDRVKIWPVESEGFIGKVSKGGTVNFNLVQLSPHGNGTHTENVGHISEAFYSINQSLTQFFYNAFVVSVQPQMVFNPDFNQTDEQISAALLEEALKNMPLETEALVVRTLPNKNEKQDKNYSQTNPPYITQSAMELINKKGIKHLLVDLPSVDREQDHGALVAHKTFWNYPENPQLDKTITEMIYVSDEIKDGTYVLNLQIISLENDASPSKPILYAINKK